MLGADLEINKSPVSVLVPANVCVPVVTTPPKLASAGCRFKTVPVIVAAFAFGVAPIALRDSTPPSA